MLQNGPHGAASALCHPETFQLARSSSAGPALWESEEGWNYMKLSYVKDYERNSELMHTAPSKDESFAEDATWFLLLEEFITAQCCYAEHNSKETRDPKHPY